MKHCCRLDDQPGSHTEGGSQTTEKKGFLYSLLLLLHFFALETRFLRKINKQFFKLKI